MTTDVPDADVLLDAYRAGLFPMARGRRSAGVEWFCPDPRALLPLDERFRVRRSLAKRVRHAGFTMTRDRAFAEVIARCAQPRPDAPETWISDELAAVYVELHRRGHAHSVEAWRVDELVGGLYGVSVGAAFCGESMFSREPDASQVCLVHLVEHLRQRGYALLDTQFVNPHLEQFGVYEIPAEQYLRDLADAVRQPVTWEASGG